MITLHCEDDVLIFLPKMWPLPIIKDLLLWKTCTSWKESTAASILSFQSMLPSFMKHIQACLQQGSASILLSALYRVLAVSAMSAGLAVLCLFQLDQVARSVSAVHCVGESNYDYDACFFYLGYIQHYWSKRRGYQWFSCTVKLLGILLWNVWLLQNAA